MIGVSVPQLDIPSKTNGTAKYGIDVMLPGMVYGKIVTPPVRYGATVEVGRRQRREEGAGLHQGRHRSTTRPRPTTGWVVAVANTYAGATKAADALKISL